jgi:F-type H+-transporting ATPase subunit b
MRALLNLLGFGISFLRGVVVMAAEEHTAASAHVNWWGHDGHAPPVGWAFVNFFIFVLVLVYFSRKPIVRAFAQRHETVKKAIDDAQEQHTKAQAHFRDSHEKNAHVETEVKDLLSRAVASGEGESARLVADAQAYAKRLRQDVEGVAAQESLRMAAKLSQTTVEEAVAAAEVTLRDKLTEADHLRLFEAALAELEAADAATYRQRTNSAPSRLTGGTA